MRKVGIGRFKANLKLPVLIAFIIASLIVGLFSTRTSAAVGGQEREAYYGNWDIYGNNLFLKDLVNNGTIANLTTLVYSFENIDPANLTCFQTSHPVSPYDSDPNAGDGGGDSWADFQRPFTAAESVSGIADSPTQPLRGNFNQLKELKAKYPKLRIILSVGGWTFSKYFSDAAKTPDSRTKFVSSCLDMYIRGNLPTGVADDTTSGGAGVAKGIFDGIDIDWEFPDSPDGHAGNDWSPDDTDNYVSLLSNFRSQLDQQGTADGRYYYLTAAVPSGADAINTSAASRIEPYLDWAGVMTYDMHGAWEGTGPTNFQAPLYSSLADPSYSQHLSVSESAQRWVDAGWPANKLVIGVPFYWRGWSGVPSGTTNGLYQSATGGSPAFPITNQAGVANYKELLAAGKVKNVHIDNPTKSPWIYDNGNFYTGDTADTLGIKGSFIRQNGYRGAMIYSVEGDDKSATLLKATVKGLNGGAPAASPLANVVTSSNRTSSSSKNTATNGEPINMVGGNFLADRTDIKIPNKDNPLNFTMSYNSVVADQISNMGWGWNNNFRITAVGDTDGSVVVQNPDGRMDRFTLNASGGYDAPSGTYDTLTLSGSQYKVTHKDQSVYNFNDKGLISSIVSPNGNTLTMSYDSNDMLTSVSNGVGRSITFTYTDDGQVETVTDSSGRTASYTYDDVGNLATAKNLEGKTTTYAYDLDHHLTKITDPNGNDVVLNEYDDQGRVTKQTNGLGHVVTLSYAPGQTTFTDANNGQTVYSYDDQLRITNIHDAEGGDTSTTYDAAGNVYQTTDPLGHTTTYLYDSHGNVTQVTNPAGGIETFTYDSQDNLLTSTDELNHTTTYEYDAHGNVTKKTDQDNNVTTYVYDANGQLKSVTDPLNNLTGFVYDDAGNRVTTTDASNRNTYYGYDSVGRLTAVEDADNEETDLTLDPMDRVTMATDPMGNETTYSYDADGNKTSVTDANNHTTSYQYDANNNLVKTTNALNKDTNYTYDNNDNLTKVTDAKNNAKAYTYDLLNRQTQTTDGLNKTTTVAYDADGNVVSRTDASNRTTTYIYDDLNRLTTVTYPDSTTASYTYNAVGDVLTATNATGTTTYTYDDLDRVTTVTDPHGAIVTYTYDAGDNLRQVKYPDGKTVSYTYTPAKQLSTAKDWNNTTTTYLYDNEGRVATKEYPNTFTAYYTYDAAGNLTDLTYDKGNNTFTDFSYSRDPVGNVTEDDEVRGSGAEKYSAYTYDALNQITKDDAPAHTWKYTYDDVGNMATQTADGTVANYTYNEANQLTATGSRSFTYDNQGNEVTDGTKTLGYNFDNQLSSYTSGTTTTSYAYDATGNRIEKSGPANYQYVNVGNNNVLVAKNVTAGTSTFYVYGNDLVSQGGAAASSRQYYLTDGLGNVKYVTSNTGAVLNTYSYDPWGGNQTLNGSTANSNTYQAEQKDSESNLVYLRARYYDPTLGRFTSLDSSGGSVQNPALQNGYNYANDNPVNMNDPLGLWAIGLHINLSLGFIGYGSVNIGVGYASKSGFYGSFTPGWGISNGASADASVGFDYSNADTACEMGGWNGGGGISVGEGVTGQGEIGGSDYNGRTIANYSAGVGAGFNLSPPVAPYESHVGYSYSWMAY